MSISAHSEPVEVVIRELTPSDAEAAAALSGELGYPVSADGMRRRLQHFSSISDRVIYAACAGELVVGWIDVGLAHHLQSEPYGEIGGLIVSAAYRGKGIGRRLVAHAEHWIANHGLTKVVVRSRIAREAAHAFYLGQGYERVKTSAVFMKDLPHETKWDSAVSEGALKDPTQSMPARDR